MWDTPLQLADNHFAVLFFEYERAALYDAKALLLKGGVFPTKILGMGSDVFAGACINPVQVAHVHLEDLGRHLRDDIAYPAAHDRLQTLLDDNDGNHIAASGSRGDELELAVIEAFHRYDRYGIIPAIARSKVHGAPPSEQIVRKGCFKEISSCIDDEIKEAVHGLDAAGWVALLNPQTRGTRGFTHRGAGLLAAAEVRKFVGFALGEISADLGEAIRGLDIWRSVAAVTTQRCIWIKGVNADVDVTPYNPNLDYNARGLRPQP